LTFIQSNFHKNFVRISFLSVAALLFLFSCCKQMPSLEEPVYCSLHFLAKQRNCFFSKNDSSFVSAVYTILVFLFGLNFTLSVLIRLIFLCFLKIIFYFIALVLLRLSLFITFDSEILFFLIYSFSFYKKKFAYFLKMIISFV
jgi:hypothetical protein